MKREISPRGFPPKRKKGHTFVCPFWRRHPESDRGIADLQSAALPLGYGAILSFREKITGLLYKPVTVGADYGARTRHLDLGKVALYQMS